MAERQNTAEARLEQMSARLRLSYMGAHMAEIIREATEAKMTPRETLEYFFSKEIDQRESNRIKLSMMGAHFPKVQTLESFETDALPSLDTGTFRELGRLEWIDRAENLLLLGPPGVGKTHIAIGLGRKAVTEGKSVLFTSAGNLLASLEKAEKEGVLSEKLAALSKPQLLIIDELGYLQYSPGAAHLLFRLVNRRYEHKSILLTSNRPIGEWGLVLGDPTAATAILDRLIHHCTTLTLTGDSYLMKAYKRFKLTPKQ